MGTPVDAAQGPGHGRTLLVTLFLVSAPVLFAQSRREEFLKVTAWRGAFNMKVDRSGEDKGVKWHFQGTARGDLVFDTADLANTPPRWLGTIQNSAVNVRADLSYTTGAGGQCAVTGVFIANGPLNPPSGSTRPAVRVMLNVWDLRLSPIIAKATYTRTVACPSGTTTTVSNGSTAIPNLDPASFPYPPSGFVLEGSGKAGAATGIPDSSTPIPLQGLDWDFGFRLEPAVDDLALEVDSSDYDTWRPRAEPGPKPGAPLKLTATVKRSSGETAQVKVSRFVWELVDTSREPGIAINFPLYAKDRDPDLKFDPQSGQFVTGDDNQKIERPAPDGVQDSAVVLPYDWGAWSTLQVTAFLADGGKLVGKFKGSQEEGVRLPKRAKDSFIADAWRKAGQGRDGKDNSDDESSPEGDGNPGDGLALYEEYRGFYEDGAHVEGNPARKDYFAYNAAGSMGEGGLLLFRQITGLDVHYRLNRNEFDTVDRVVNGNYSASPRLGDQHGVWLKYADFDGFAQAVSNGSGPSTPKDILFVGVPVSMPGRKTANAAVSYGAASIAHELLHTVNVWHHGDQDREVVWQRSGGLLLEVDSNAGVGSPIRVFLESGNEVTASELGRLADGKGRPQYIGVKNGEHSGYENCVMRYDIAGAYVSEANSSDRYLVKPSETPGVRLCDTRVGIAVNADGRSPQPRYFSAASNRGDCKHQILVNDRVSAPRR